MWLMLQQKEASDFVVATGETYSVRQFLDEVFGLLGLDWNKYVEVDPRYFRPAEVDLLLGDPKKAREELNWRPRVNFKGLAKMMVDGDWALARGNGPWPTMTAGHRKWPERGSPGFRRPPRRGTALKACRTLACFKQKTQVLDLVT